MQITERDLKKSPKDYFKEESLHYPVMYREVLTFLNVKKAKIVVDCTVGVASHALKILPQLNEGSFYVGIDKDSESLRIAQRRLHRFEGKFILIKDDFRNLDNILRSLNIKEVDAFFFDLGISSFQLSLPERGFSFLKEGPLDMRMDRSAFLCASDLVNNLSEKELVKIFEKFGEERYSRRIAHFLVEERRKAPFFTTSQLKLAILKAIPKRDSKSRIHPATRVFQALRIAVNRELDCLEEGLEKAVRYLSTGGRIVVISFHSLEDRIVKHIFRDYSHRGILNILTKKPLLPKEDEIEVNISSRSAKLRAGERTPKAFSS